MKILIFLILTACFLHAQPTDIMNKYLLAQSYEQSGDYERAKTLYEEVYRFDPNSLPFYEALNRIYTQVKNYDASILLIEGRMKQYPTEPMLHAQLGRTYFLMGNEGRAKQAWEQGIALHPSNPSNYKLFAAMATELRTFDIAIEFLNRGKQVTNDPRFFSYDLANLYQAKMQYAAAAKEYAELLKRDPNQAGTIETRIIAMNRGTEALQEMIAVFEDMADESDVSVSRLLISLHLAAGTVSRAVELAKQVDKKVYRDGTELINLAARLEQEKHLTEAAGLLAYILETYPQSPMISRVRLSSASVNEELINRKYQSQIPDWKPLFKPEPVRDPGYKAIIAAYTDIISQYEGNEIAAEALYRCGKLMLLTGSPQEAEPYFAKVVSHYPASNYFSSSCFALADLALQREEIESAARQFQSIIGHPRTAEPDKNRARFELAELELLNGKRDAAMNYLNTIAMQLQDPNANDALILSMVLNPQLTDSVSLLSFSKAELRIRQMRFDDALELLAVPVADSRSVLLQQSAHFRSAEVLTALSRYAEAVTVLDTIAAGKGIHADKAAYLTAQLYQHGTKETDKAVAAYEKILVNFPSSLYLDKVREELLYLKSKVL